MTRNRDIHDVLGFRPAYPGHPLALAWAIIQFYPDLQGAFQKTEQGWPEALADQRIPGGGGCVYAALRLLRSLLEGESLEKTLKEADKIWVNNALNDKTRARGLEQVKPLRKKITDWANNLTNVN